MNADQRQLLRGIAREHDKKTAVEMGLKLAEEVGELARQVLIHEATDGTKYRGEPARADLIEEIADVYIVLMALAERMGVVDEEIERAVHTKSLKWRKVVNSGS